jgi:flavin reductase (DIM6/NTAB) family NADH-FMN oxidoreductase RutF
LFTVISARISQSKDFADDEVCIGDRFRIGGAIFEVSQPRVTCYKLGLRLNHPEMPALLVSHRRAGFYFRVIQEGEVGAGDRIERIADGPEQMTVAEIDALLYSSHHPIEALRRAIRIPALSPGWQGSMRALLEAAEKGEDGGNAGLSPTPAVQLSWRGFRPLKVVASSKESIDVRSFELAALDGSLSQMPPSLIPFAGAFAEVDSESFRAAMRELAGGVAVITVGKDSDITGFTARSVASLSTHPPRLVVCVAQSSASWHAIQRHPCFVVNLLRDEERALANRFAGRDGLEGAARYAGARWTTMLTATPVLENALAAFDCEVAEMLPRYDHAIIIGRVCAVRACPGSFPLVYWQGDYHPFERTIGSK